MDAHHPPPLTHLWVAPDERVDPAEVLLGRLVAGAGGPARFHVTANGGWEVGAPAEEVDETKPRPLSLSLSLSRTTSALSQVCLADSSQIALGLTLHSGRYGV